MTKAITAGLNAAIPEGNLTVSQWAERYRYVSLERVADPGLAGRWKNSTTPYLVGPMDAVTDPTVNEIVFVKSSQVGGTEFINNVLGYYIHIDPATVLYVCENEGKARAWSVESFAPMIRDTPVLADIFGQAKERDSSNMIEAKAFRGGHFALAWATSPATLSSRPRRIVLTDETDAFAPTKEGDPVKLAEARTKTAKTQRKIIHVSTPRDKETSVIEPMFKDSTAEKFFLPCLHCNEYQALKWSNVRWDESPIDAYYICDACGVIIENEEKADMLAKGQWRPTNPEYIGNRRGFWINELYSPFTTWGEMAVAFIESKPYPDKLKVFINTRLAETWEEKGEQIEYADLQFHREEYEAEVPQGVVLLTAGVDVQGDRLECEIVGHGRDLESWSIDYRIFYGSPAFPDVWDELSDYLMSDFESISETYHRVAAAAIDSGGHHAAQVYKFCKANAGRRWFAIKGASMPGKPLVSKPSLVGKQKVKLFSVGTDTAKDEIFACLKIGEAGPGYAHFPARDPYDEKYFKQLCSEKKITKYVQGVAKQVWVKVHESVRNEALDCRVYGIAARAIINPNLSRIADRRLQRAITEPKDADSVNGEADNQTPVKQKRRVVMSKKRGGFATNW